MLKQFFCNGVLAALVSVSLGCNRTTTGPSTTRTTEKTTTTTSAPTLASPATADGVDVNAGPNGEGRTEGGGVDVNVAPNGGVGVDVQGEPIRERIRERRAARDADLRR
jgi:hypothetical protein